MKINDNWNIDDEDDSDLLEAPPSNPRVSRSTSSDGTRRVSRPEDATRRPSRPKDATRRPSRPEDATRRPSRPEDATRRPSRPEDATRRPSRPEDATRRPSHSEDATRRPSRSEDGTRRPSRSEDATRRPSRSEDATRRPSRSEDGIRKPAQSKEYLDNLQTPTIPRNASRGSSDDILAEIKYDLNKIDSNEDLHFKKDDEKFKINVREDVRKIPNYIPSDSGEVSGISVFAKVMFGIMIVAISVGISITIIFCGSNILGLGTPDADYVIEIDLNSDMEKVSKTLANYGVIESATLFKTYVDITVGKDENEPVVQFGTYLLNSSMSYDEMLAELLQYSSTVREVSIMFKEGTTIYQMSKLLQENGVCNAQDFIKTIQEVDFGYDFLNNDTDNKYLFHNKEGYMFPDTYMFFINDDPVNVAKKMIQNYNNRVTAVMEEALTTNTLSQHEIMTIASIVQLEAPDIENMKKVASVYLNRIKNPGEYSQLQADPTKEYANELKLQMAIIDQEIIDAYNTYAGIGLPPGPVCNPGLDAIIAVLEPADTDYFYFCTNLYTGEFYFADNLEDHNKNVYNAGLRQ